MKYLALVFLLAAQTTHAAKLLSPRETFQQFSCKKNVSSFEKEWGAVGDWRGHVTPEGRMGLLKRTSKFAHWIVLEKSNGVESVTLMNPENAQKVVFDKKCKGTLSVYAHNHFSNDKGVNDTALLKEMMNHEKGIVALWSPGMQHSGTAIERLQKVSKEMNLPVLFVMDPFADEKNAEEFLKDRKIAGVKIARNSSLELFYRDATMHYPNFLVYKDGEFKGFVIPGVMGEGQYREAILNTLGSK